MSIITDGDFSKLMDKIYPQNDGSNDCNNIAVACSGGHDSMALALLMRDWAKTNKYKMAALIVDHKLRDDSTNEAKLVKKRLNHADITAHILTRKSNNRLTTDIQNKARIIRYQLLQQWCVANNYKTIAIAHHMQDQAETFLLRLARGSGVYGLSAMEKSSKLKVISNEPNAINLIRPLLDINKTDLIDSLTHFNIKAIDDPSNKNEQFDRVKIRNNQLLFDNIGLSAKRLASTAKNLRRARNALEEITNQAINKTTKFYPTGYCIFDKKLLLNQAEEIGLRALSNIITIISGGKYPPRLSKIENLYTNLINNKNFNGCSLAGTIIAPSITNIKNQKKTMIIIFREHTAINDIRHIKNKVIWDNRFLLEFNLSYKKILKNSQNNKIEIRKLGDLGRIEINKNKELSHDIPKKIMPSLPALWVGEELLFVPHINNIADEKEINLVNISPLMIKKSVDPFYSMF